MLGKGEYIAREEWRKYGRIMPACVIGVMLSAVPNYTLGAMIPSLQKEFGWSRAQISIGPLIPSLAAIIIAPLVGSAIDRFGPRRIALFGVPIFCAALVALSTVTRSILSWWALYAMSGIAVMFVLAMVWTSAINARFVRNRGLALAVALAGTGLSAAIMPFLSTVLVAWQGWRAAYVSIGLLGFAVAFPATYFLFDCRDGAFRPSDLRSSKRVNRAAVRAQMLSPVFLKLAAAMLLFSFATTAITSNAVLILLAEDFSPVTAGAIAGAIGVGSIVGRLGAGLLLDRFDARFVAAGSVLAPSFTAILLLATQGSAIPATIGCFLFGLAAGAEYDACAYLTARHFSLDNFGALFGLISGISLLANGAAPALSNHVYDLVHSYDPVLSALIPTFLTAALLFIWLGRYPDDAADRQEMKPSALVSDEQR